MSLTQNNKPDYVTGLETIFGKPNQEAFGSTVLFEQGISNKNELEKKALEKYQYFIGPKWAEREEVWRSSFKQVYERTNEQDIIAELKSITDVQAANSASILLDGVENADAGYSALASAYNSPDVDALKIYTTGDGEALSGILLAGKRSNGDGTFLVFMMD